MEAKLLHQSLSSFMPTRNNSRRQRASKPLSSPVLAVLTRPAEKIVEIAEKTMTTRRPEEDAIVTKYEDNWFDLMATNYLSRSVQAAIGIRNKKSGYDGLVEAASAGYRSFNPTEQRDLVISALDRAFPRPILNMIRTLLPQSKFTREYFAAFTTVFFSWLVGKCEVRESELDGRREKNVVHINKCRFLEETNCVGMCLNLCKMPCQTFIKDSLGVPVNMVPNFDDMSCQMVFGQDPPAMSDDPAFKQPCFKLCKAKQKHSATCTS
ncbi:hypothetical protein BT93_K0659 [Corymbia citriodora subsp. variegata]|nr:hypothetical protein BT93_K0659 [Corymbia citriodora subsp. variegata]